MSQQGYIGRNPGDGRTIVNRQTTHVTTGVQTSFTMTVGYEVGYLDVYLNGIKQTETLDYTASDGSTIDFSLSYPPVNGDVLEFVAFETLNISNIKSARRNFTIGQDLDVSGKVTIGSSLTVASDLVVNGTFTTINTEILDVEDKTVGIASTSSPSNTTADGAGIVIYGGSDGDKSLTWNSTKSNFVLVGGGVSIGTGVTISTPAANVLAFSVNSAEKARFNNFGAFTVGYEGEAWHESTYVGVLQAGSGAWIGQTPGASARAEWVNNAYYDSVNTRWEYIAGDEANRIVLENGELKVQSADAGSADGAITWNEKLKMTVGGDFKIGAPTGIGITISSSGNVDSIGIVTATTFVGAFTGTASGNTTISNNADNRVITGGSGNALNGESGLTYDGSNLSVTGGFDASSDISLADTIKHTGDTDTKIRFPAANTISLETAGSERFRIDSSGHVGINETSPDSNLSITDSENTTYDASQASHQRDAGATLRIQNNSTTTDSFAQLLLRNQSSNTGGCRIVSINKGNNASDLAITTGDTSESVRITSANLVGIGTISPGGLFHTHTASGTNRNLIEASASHAFLRLKAGSTSYNSGLEFYSGTSNIANLSALGGGGVTFEVGGSERVRITSSGHLKLPDAAELRLGGAQDASGDIVIQHNGSNSSITNNTGGFYISGDGTDLHLRSAVHTTFSTGGSNERMRISSDGQVLIGTTTAGGYTNRKLVVGDTSESGNFIEIRTSSSGTGHLLFADSAAGDANNYTGYVAYTHSSNAMTFHTNGGNERFRFGSAGQLGIAGANYGSSGQVLTSQGSSSAPTWAAASGGKVLQVVTVTKTDTASLSVSGGTSHYMYNNTSLMADITAANSNNKFLIMASITTAGPSVGVGVALCDDGSVVSGAVGASPGSRQASTSGHDHTDTHAASTVPITAYITAGDTSQHRFHCGFTHTSGSTQTIYINRGTNDANGSDRIRYISTITVMEIEA